MLLSPFTHDSLDDVLRRAIDLGASDIHLEPIAMKRHRIRYRVDGYMIEEQRRKSLADRLIARVKVLAHLDLAEKRRPQDGRFSFVVSPLDRASELGTNHSSPADPSLDFPSRRLAALQPQGERAIDERFYPGVSQGEAERRIAVRVSVMPTRHGEKAVLRLLDSDRLPLDFGALGLRPTWSESLTRAVASPHGLVLVTGPTGSGKTTTLYAALNYLNEPSSNLCSVEDPIEYELPGVNQTGVRADIGLNFASVLRAQLRQDPDVIMVGEIRDSETAEIAVRAALTGHLVLSTLHTNDAASTVSRLLDVGVEPFLVASSLRLVVAQRLLRKVCASCSIERAMTPAEAAQLGIDAGDGQMLREAVGCEVCHGTGYRGRTPVMEIMSVSEEIASLIGAQAPTRAIREAAQAGGMVLLREAAAQLVLEGVTTVSEALRETY